jgi:hypothetical protein
VAIGVHGEDSMPNMMYTPRLLAYTNQVKRIQIYIEDDIDEQLSRRARRERRSKAALIRDAVRREFAEQRPDPLDDWAGGVDDAPGDIDELIYRR